MRLTIDQSRLFSLLFGVALFAVASSFTVGAETPARHSVPLPTVVGETDGVALRAVLTEANTLYLEAQPLPGEGLLAFCRRLCGTSQAAAQVREANGGARQLLAGRWYRVPLELLTEAHRSLVFAALFPGDEQHAGGWRHEVGRFAELPDESLWRIAQRFTGSGENYPAIRLHNELPDNTLYRGQKLWIPSDLLLPVYRSHLPPPAVSPARKTEVEASVPSRSAAPGTSGAPPVETAVRTSARLPAEAPGADPAEAATASPAVLSSVGAYGLRYGRDAEGEYAIYHLKPGEALYSSVVVRFTGRIYAADVNALAKEIAKRNGIADVTDMPIGFPVKIPRELLQAEFLPADDPQRREFDETQRASAAFSNPVRSQDLQGVTVIIDAGHGGRDVGASKLGVWESIYVYDIAMRLKRHLETTTAAQVLTTTRDGAGYHIPDRDVLPYSNHHVVLTNPPYPLTGDSKVGVNLRWYLANSLYRAAIARGRKPENVVFISIHADSLHPSLRGAMAYIPDAYLRSGSHRKTGTVYTAHREVREKPEVSYSWKERVRSQGLSRQLADQVVEAFRRQDLMVHPDQPVRQKIYRGSRPWVPAVLRYNAVPAEMLLEVGNLANEEDRKLLQTRAFRQRSAEAITDGLRAYYGVSQRSTDVKVARTR
jgi:N-acetylmuramoyl-L-alanine amidase